MKIAIIAQVIVEIAVILVSLHKLSKGWTAGYLNNTLGDEVTFNFYR